jgi:hypothetical protein
VSAATPAPAAAICCSCCPSDGSEYIAKQPSRHAEATIFQTGETTMESAVRIGSVPHHAPADCTNPVSSAASPSSVSTGTPHMRSCFSRVSANNVYSLREETHACWCAYVAVRSS